MRALKLANSYRIVPIYFILFLCTVRTETTSLVSSVKSAALIVIEPAFAQARPPRGMSRG